VGGPRLLLSAATGVLVLACGPSFQAVYECDVRFEHCYALDQEDMASADAKKACWRDWLHGYTYGQPRDRVEYAATRFSELSLDPTLPKVETEAPKRVHAMAVPAPTNAFAPPPNVAERGPAGEGSASPAAPAKSATPAAATAAHAPGEECAESCASYWNACHKTCKDGACDACDRAYRLCVPACFPKR
jgi:hypothetical protein